jgi:hypothetical protein
MADTPANPKKPQSSMQPLRAGLTKALQVIWNGLTMLFSFSRKGGWLRLLFVFALSAFFFAGVTPISTWISKLGSSVQDIYPTIKNTVTEISKMFRPAPETGEVVITPLQLPQPDLSTRLELIRISPDFSRIMQSIIMTMIPFAFSMWVAAYYFQYIHRIPSFWAAFIHIFRTIFPIPRAKLRLQDGIIMQRQGKIPIQRLGGPVRAFLSETNSAVFEKSDGKYHILHAGQENIPVEGYESLRSALDLREHNLTLTVSGYTRDGVRLKVRNAKFTYRIFPGQNEEEATAQARLGVYHDLVYRHWPGNDWDKPIKRQRDMTAFISTEMRHFIAQYDLGDFMGNLITQQVATKPGYQAQNMLAVFAEGFAQQVQKASLGQPGSPIIQLRWLGEGEWLLLSDIRLSNQPQTWYTWLENRMRKAPAYQKNVQSQNYQEETNRLVQQVPLAPYQALRGGTRQNLANGLGKAYRDRLKELQNEIPMLEAQVREDLDLVLFHLDRLIGK